MCNLYILFILIIHVFTYSVLDAFASVPGDELMSSRYRMCSTTADCTLYKDICTPFVWYPVNRNSVTLLEKMDDTEGGISCMSLSPQKPAVECVNHICALRPDKENCILRAGADWSPPYGCIVYCDVKYVNGICAF
jgi:hypothetical protein